jgi:fatty acid desaturase
VPNPEEKDENTKEIKNIAEQVTEQHATAYRELQKEVLTALGGFRNSKGTPGFFIKAFVIMSLAITLETLQWIYGFTIYRAILLGCCMALVGLNIMHDANHGAASFNSNVNYILGLLQDWIGGSAIHWRHHHVVLHHIHTNTEADPDIRAKPLLRIHPKDEPDQIHQFQHLYIWPILSLLVFRIIVLEPIDLATGNMFGYKDKRQVGDMEHRFAEATQADRHISLLLRSFFYLRFIILPLMFVPEWNTALCIYASIATTSLYAGVLFIVSHNFTDVEFHPSNGDDKRISFMAAQVETSCNWGDWVAIQLCGGLNCEFICQFTFLSIPVLFNFL